MGDTSTTNAVLWATVLYGICAFVANFFEQACDAVPAWRDPVFVNWTACLTDYTLQQSMQHVVQLPDGSRQHFLPDDFKTPWDIFESMKTPVGDLTWMMHAICWTMLSAYVGCKVFAWMDWRWPAIKGSKDGTPRIAKKNLLIKSALTSTCWIILTKLHLRLEGWLTGAPPREYDIISMASTFVGPVAFINLLGLLFTLAPRKRVILFAASIGVRYALAKIIYMSWAIFMVQMELAFQIMKDETEAYWQSVITGKKVLDPRPLTLNDINKYYWAIWAHEDS